MNAAQSEGRSCWALSLTFGDGGSDGMVEGFFNERRASMESAQEWALWGITT